MRRLLFLTGLVLATALLQAPAPAAAQSGFEDAELEKLVDGLRNGTLPPSLAGEDCRAYLQARDDDGLDEVMSGYLEVPEQLGHAAFCASLVDAIRSGTVTLESLQIIAGQRDDAAMFFEVGHLLRAIYFSHRATTTAATTAEVPQ